jgi:hypothetical protein
MAIFHAMYQTEYRPAWTSYEAYRADNHGMIWETLNSQAIGTEETFTGAVLALGEMNGRDDSDFYAVVYDSRIDSVYRVEYATTRFGGGGNAVVDATPEVMEKAEAAMARSFFAEWKYAAGEAAEKVEPGKEVTSVTTRGKNKGRKGIVKVRCEGKAFRPVYSEWAKPEDRCLVEATDGGEDFWINVSGLKVEDPAQYLRPVAEGREKAARAAAQRNWRYMGSGAQGFYFA